MYHCSKAATALSLTSQVNHPADGDYSPLDSDWERTCLPPCLSCPVLPARVTGRPELDWAILTCRCRLNEAAGGKATWGRATGGWLREWGDQHGRPCWVSPVGPHVCWGSSAGRHTRRHPERGSAARKAATNPAHHSHSHWVNPHPATPHPLWSLHRSLCSRKQKQCC